MCGICGFIGKHEKREEILEEMMDAIRHRGPDSGGSCITEHIAFGFRRLSIIDVETGDQPLQNEDKNLTLVFNGEIYNYQKLMEELKKKGHVFATHGDSETLVHGYETYGKNLPDHLRGMFAFAVWDERKMELFAVRDFFGIKPFYYAMIDGCFVFASEIKSILKFPGYKKAVNEEALEQYLTFQYGVTEETFFKGIYRLLPGHNLTYKNGKIKTIRYFTPFLGPEKVCEDGKIIRKLDQILKQSVQRHMVSDVEIGTFLSGGVDSGYLASQFTGTKAFTVGFRDENSLYNEIRSARCLAEKLYLDHYAKVITKEEYWDSIPKVMYYLDEPSGDASAEALYFLCREASKKVKTVVSGEGSDEIFGGYNIYLEPSALWWTKWIPHRIRRKMASFAQNLPEVKGKNYMIRAGKSLEERFVGNANIFSTLDRRKILKNATGAPSSIEFLRNTYQKIYHEKDETKMQTIDLNYWLPGDILQKADKMSMANSLEVRVPFLDRDVFEVARTLPIKGKIRKHQTKYLFRKVAEKYLPRESAQMRKLGFPVPIRIWIREEPWYSRIREMFHGVAAETFFCTDELLRLLEEHKEGKRDNSRKIWTVVSFLIWYQVYFETEDFRPENK